MSEQALVIGESLIDIVRTAQGAEAEFPGGSPLNVAIGLARLGRKVELSTWFGRDVRGEAITKHLADSGVALTSGSDSAPHTSTAQANVDAKGVASYVFDLTWQVPPATAEVHPLVLHTGSIATTLPPGCTDVAALAAAARSTSTITYDPNMRPDLMGSPEQTRPVVAALVELADVVKVSDEDLDWLMPGADILSVAREWVARGPALVVVTRGSAGSLAVTASGEVFQVATPTVKVADTVGAGDSFMAGLIDGLWQADLLGAGRREALRSLDAVTANHIVTRAARIAAITVSRPGANPPWHHEL